MLENMAVCSWGRYLALNNLRTDEDTVRESGFTAASLASLLSFFLLSLLSFFSSTTGAAAATGVLLDDGSSLRLSR